MSQMFHFHWDGKERSVSISRSEDGLVLHFVDPQLEDTLGGKVILAKKDEGWDYFTSITRTQLQLLNDLLQALEMHTGKDLKSLSYSNDHKVKVPSKV
ncbi:MAG TPA: hypothetical protein VNS32_03485 [Flavisolibacter sp.]|nr:hypothetical protein [Flavisolibacter sp.]